MLERQTTWIEDEDDDDEEEDGDQEQQQPAKVEPVDSGQPTESQEPDPDPNPIAGFCGRCGKIADTCYCFWNVGALKVRRFQRVWVADSRFADSQQRTLGRNRGSTKVPATNSNTSHRWVW